MPLAAASGYAAVFPFRRLPGGCASMWSTRHPLWQAGFRPFFPLAALAAAVLPLAWIGMLHGWWPVPPLPGGAAGVQWHAHEMFYGFGGAVVVGFLLTASKNWVGIGGYKGASLMALAAAWGLERITTSYGAHWPPALFWAAELLFPLLAVGMLLHTLIAHRKFDGFAAENLFFILVLPLLLPAKVLLLRPETFVVGEAMTVGIFRLVFLLMLERTLPAFMQGGLQIAISRLPRVDRGIRWLALLLCLAPFGPTPLAGVGEALLAVLLLARLPGWQPHKAWRRPEIAIMFVGYLAIVVQLALSAVLRFDVAPVTASVALHVFALGALGSVVPAMFIRIANGHTGRRIVFGAYERTILALVVLALLARTLGVALFPAAYLVWLDVTAAAWSLAFALWLARFAPPLARPRVDGKPG